MSIQDRLGSEMKAAMKAGDAQRLSCIRMLRSKLQEKTVALRATRGKDHTMTDEDAIEVIGSYAKQRRDSIAAYAEAGREDLADRERAELAIIEEFLPRQLDDGELARIVGEAIETSGATSKKDMGAVMKLVMGQVKGRADGKRINRLVLQLLEKTKE